MARGFTKRQQVFIAEYVKDGNGTRAALAAGYSEKRAAVAATELVRNRKIADAIAKKTGKIIEKLDISAEKVFSEIAKLAFFDPRKLYNADGSMKPITELDDATAAAIAGMDEEKLYENFGKGQAKNTGTIKKIKFVDKGVNLERLIKWFLRISEKHEHEVKNISELSDEQLAAFAARLGVTVGTAPSDTE